MRLFFPFRAEAVIISLHPVRRVRQHPVRGMGVDVQGEAGGGVAHQLLDGFDIRPAGDGDGSRGVTKVMGPRVRSADTGGDLLEVLVERREGAVLSRFVREHQAVWVVPEGTGPTHVLLLLLPFRAEILEGDGRGLDRPGPAVLGGVGYVIGAAARLVLLELLADGDPVAD